MHLVKNNQPFVTPISSGLVPNIISLNDYTQAVSSLLLLGSQREKDSFTAATALLSLYPEFELFFDSSDLLDLDAELFKCVIILFRGAYELKRLPHTLYANGVEVIKQLYDGWIDSMNESYPLIYI